MKNTRTSFFSLSLFVVLLSTLWLSSVNTVFAIENWPMYNHDSGLTGKTDQFVTGSVSVKWKEQLPVGVHVRSQPIIVDGRLYLATVDGKLTSYDLNTGNKFWVATTGGAIYGSPVVVANRVIVPVYLGDKGELQGYDLAGSKKWTVKSTEPFMASPIFHRGAVLIGGLDQKLYSVDPEDGTVLWTKNLSGRVLGAVAAKNGMIAVQTDEFKGYGFDISGTQKWVVNLPGEVVKHANPMIGKNTVLFTTGARARDMNAIEGQPYYRETPMQTDWRGDPPLYTPPEGIVSAAEGYYAQHPQARTVFAADLQTGAERFKVGLPTPYWGSLTPLMLTDTLAFKQSHASTWTINMDTGEIKFLDLVLIRGDEYSYSSMGGGLREYGGVADFLGMIDHQGKRLTNLVRTAYSHEVPKWDTPPNDVNKYMFISGPGDGNSGYANTPVIYDNKIAWVGSGSWLGVYQGTGGSEAPDSQAPSVPTNLRTTSSSGDSVSLAWNASTDNVSVTGYKIYRDSVLIGETDTTSFTDVSLRPNTTYQFTISSVDIQNNESAKTAQVAAQTGQGTTGTPTPTPTATASVCNQDINEDGVIDLSDYSILVANFLKSPITHPRSDINRDGVVDLSDYSMLATRFLRACP